MRDGVADLIFLWSQGAQFESAGHRQELNGGHCLLNNDTITECEGEAV